MYVCMYVCMLQWHRRTSRGVRRRGCSSPPPPPPHPSYRNFCNFSGKTLMIRAKVLRRKHHKRLSKPDLKATFSVVYLVKTELRSNDLGIQVFCSGKAIYRLHVDRRNPLAGYYFHQRNNGRINERKRRPRPFLALKKAVFNGSTKSCSKIFLNFAYKEEFTASFTSFWSVLLDNRSRS